MSSKSQRLKVQLNTILNNGINSVGARIFRPFIALLVVVNIIVVTLYSFHAHTHFLLLLQFIAYISGAVFTVEYLVRIWISPLMHHNRHRVVVSRVRYMLSFYGIVDFIAILPFAIPLFFDEGNSLVELINFARLFLIFKIARYSRSFDMLREVMHSARQELLIAVSFSFIIVSFSAYAMYYIERGAQPEIFANVGDGFWWAVITFTTVGYGDIHPITIFGKCLAALIAIVGIGMIAMPTAIISSALMNRMATDRAKEQQKKNAAPEQKPHYCPHCGMKLPKETSEP